MAPSHKGKEKAETSRAVWSDTMKKIFLGLCIDEVMRGGRPGSNLKTQSWTRIIEAIKEKTGIVYAQKQLKNQWDLMRKQYNAWTTLCAQTGVGYNEVTHTITMEPERWEEYLKGHPEAKIFRTRPLSFFDEMGILFGGTQATGEETWTPSSGSLPEDLNIHVPSSPPDIGKAQNNMQQETFEENGMEELMTNVRRKRPCLSRSKKDVRNGKFDENLERLVNCLEQESKHGTTMEECIAILKQMPNIEKRSRLYFFSTRAFKDKENRDIWMSFESDEARQFWLDMIMEHGR